MIEKMKFLSITGPKADIDRVVNQYLVKYEIQLENAMAQLNTVQRLTPYIEINPYREWLNKANELLGQVPEYSESDMGKISLEEAVETVKTLSDSVAGLRGRKTSLEEQREKLKASLRRIEPFMAFQFNIHKLLGFKFIKYRFGKIAHEYYEKLEKYVYEDLDSVFFKCNTDEQYVWGIYFVPATQADEIDAVYSSMHFEQMYLPDEYEGTPKEAAEKLHQEIDEYDRKIEECQQEIRNSIQTSLAKLLRAQNCLSKLSYNFDVRKLAACTKSQGDNQVFYILCGWMTEHDAKAFQREIAADMNLYCILEDDQNNILNPPPTKLKNPKIFKPFEMFIRMYGLPAYNEIDPTIFVAVTYAFIFGAMFGDAGQGLVLLIGGAVLYRLKKMDLAAIISFAGIFSTIFGFLFGSIFGFEDIIPALWLRPVESMTQIPVIGSLNTVFIVAIAFGMFLTIMTMIFHIINGIKAKDAENTWFDTNGLAGLVFYGAIVVVLGLFVTGHTMPAAIVLVIMFVIPLLLIALKEPLSRLVEKKADLIPGGKGMFVVQTFFELFEVLLSYFSNTLSFVRIGAFAVSHAAMMEVVLMLAGAENGASPNWLVVILGNIFVIGMEGLIVGIQVLRLEYYEMFSRFYKGTGREFKPFTKKN